MADAPTLWRIELRVPRDAVGAFEELLGESCMAVSSFGDDTGPWRVEGIAGTAPDGRALVRRIAETARGLGLDAPNANIERAPPRDWLADNLANFPPLRIGRFYVHGSHVDAPPPAGAIALKLDAGRAFGTGEHPTTAACLGIITELAKRRRFRRPLDMGCGSGILALAMAKAWRVPVVACDIDPDAVAVAHANARINGVSGLVRAVCGPGFQTPAVARGGARGGYDLICANIVARPLVRMAGALARALAPGGVAVLSGLLERDGPWVLAAHRAHRLSRVRAVDVDGWRTLVVAR